MSEPRFGVWVGIDVGTVRIGVARCDPDGLIASPVSTVARDAKGDADLTKIAAIVADADARGVVVGLPRTLRNEIGASARDAQEFAARLETFVNPLPIVFVDERMTTITATQALRAGGMRGKKQRSVIDQAAAVVLLQHWLDIERPRTTSD